jgi:hypothetical protein
MSSSSWKWIRRLPGRGRANLKETEMGSCDGHQGMPRDKHCSYQASIQQLLEQFAAEHAWLGVHQHQMTRDTDVVERICEHLSGREMENWAAE